MAWWRSGYAADCKSVHPGSIPGQASKLLLQALSGDSSEEIGPFSGLVSKAPAENRA
jgi:hypothetical protein